jgi:hypothetical protein
MTETNEIQHEETAEEVMVKLGQATPSQRRHWRAKAPASGTQTSPSVPTIAYGAVVTDDELDDDEDDVFEDLT